MEIRLTNKIPFDITTKEFVIPDKGPFAKLQIIKDELKAAKSELDNYDAEKMAIFNPFRSEKYAIAKQIGADNITNAWLKMYEMISHFNLLPFRVVRHFDNAAMPGSWILATHHYMKTYRPNNEYKWRAASLLEGLTDDYELYKNYPQNWLLREDGDVSKLKNIDAIAANFDIKCNIFTSDLGFSVGNNYNIQEELHLRANIGQILLCLRTLTAGGNCVIKHYTIFEPLTLSYLFLFSHLFENCWLYKPITSKAQNSEIYIIGKNFMHYSTAYVERMTKYDNAKKKKREQDALLDKLDAILANVLENWDEISKVEISKVELSKVEPEAEITEDDLPKLISKKSIVSNDTMDKFVSYLLADLRKLYGAQVAALKNVCRILDKSQTVDFTNKVARSKFAREHIHNIGEIEAFYKICKFKPINAVNKLKVKSIF